MSDELSKEACQDCLPDSQAQAGDAAIESAKEDLPATPAEPTKEVRPEEQAPFTPPSLESLRPSITIEFCDRCRW